MAAPTDSVRAAIEPVVVAEGCDLEDVDITPAGRRSVVRVIIDSDEGIDLDRVAEISRAIGAVLDSHDALGESAYTLEVTSPGVDRPLTTPRHWRRAAGRLVKTTMSGSEMTGRVIAADDVGVTFEVGPAERYAPYAEIGAGQVQIEFNPPKRVSGDSA